MRRQRRVLISGIFLIVVLQLRDAVRFSPVLLLCDVAGCHPSKMCKGNLIWNETREWERDLDVNLINRDSANI